jgi:hypothetical protein
VGHRQLGAAAAAARGKTARRRGLGQQAAWGGSLWARGLREAVGRRRAQRGGELTAAAAMAGE